MQAEKIRVEMKSTPFSRTFNKGFMQGITLTAIIAFLATQIAKLPFFSIMGPMIIAILLGMTWKIFYGYQPEATNGINFSSKRLLRGGIILLGIRLQLIQIYEAGITILLVDITVVTFTIIVMIIIGRMLKIDKALSILLSVGTAVCGAAAIMAIAPIIKSKNELNALAVAYIALFGTIGSLIYIFVFQVASIDPYHYGVLVGSTLHELAHVIAASAPGGIVTEDTAMMVKLGRVALLVPVGIIIGSVFSTKQSLEKKSFRDLPIPWFIVGFLLMSLLNTLSIIPKDIIHPLIYLSSFLLTMAMAGLGLSTEFKEFTKAGWRPSILGFIGFILLAGLGVLVISLL